MLEYNKLEQVFHGIEQLDIQIKIPAKHARTLPLGSWLVATLDTGEMSIMQIIEPIQKYVLPICKEKDRYVASVLKDTIKWINSNKPETLEDIMKASIEIIETILYIINIWADYKKTYPQVQLYNSWTSRVDIEQQWISKKILEHYITQKLVYSSETHDTHGFEPFVKNTEKEAQQLTYSSANEYDVNLPDWMEHKEDEHE